MPAQIILNAAAILDDIASKTLCPSDFYFAIEDAGIAAVDLCKMILRERSAFSDSEYEQLCYASECLSHIWMGTNTDKLKAALEGAKKHSDNLFSILDNFQEAAK